MSASTSSVATATNYRNVPDWHAAHAAADFPCVIVDKSANFQLGVGPAEHFFRKSGSHPACADKQCRLLLFTEFTGPRARAHVRARGRAAETRRNRR